jgi:hypothetical protein
LYYLEGKRIRYQSFWTHYYFRGDRRRRRRRRKRRRLGEEGGEGRTIGKRRLGGERERGGRRSEIRRGRGEKGKKCGVY